MSDDTKLDLESSIESLEHPEEPHDPHELPGASPGPRRTPRFSIVWVVPILAALAGAILLIRALVDRGPTITISFETAEGLEAGKTEVRYKNVVVGRVSAIALSDDHSRVTATVDVTRNAAKLAVADSQFWVERPRVALSGVSGISTLLSGAYIGVDIGVETAQRKAFVGLERPPAFLRDQRGRLFALTSPDAGSLSAGSPVYYRRVQVGAVSGTELGPDNRTILLHVFVRAPYDKLVTRNARFWNASGVDLTVGPEGLKLNTESLATVVAGGIAFQTFDDSPDGPPAEGTVYELYEDRVAASAQRLTTPVMAHMTFEDSVRGLAVGTPVELRGVTLGKVSALSLQLDPSTKTFRTEVVATLYPDRMGPAYETLRAMDEKAGRSIQGGLQVLVDERDMHAQLRSANPFIGQTYVALDFFPASHAKSAARGPDYVGIPTEHATMDDLEKGVRDIIKKLDSIPFGEIGVSLRDTLRSASSVVAQLDKFIAPEARKIFEAAQRAIRSLEENVAAPDSELQTSTRATLSQIERAAGALRALSEFLEQHPESLLRGRDAPKEPKGAR